MGALDMVDAVLVANCAEVQDFYASYVTGCRILEEVEFDTSNEVNHRELQQKTEAAGRQWRAALARLTTTSVLTPFGLLTKARTIGDFYLDCPPDSEIISAMYSVLQDLERFV